MCWSEKIAAAIEGARSVVLLGVGNELMGDDGAGAMVAKQLGRIKKQNAKFKIEVFETGTTPENFTGPISRIKPDLVIMVDAADMGRPVGEVVFLEPEAMGSMMHSTHTMPLSFLADYIRRTSGAGVAALGIQAARIDLDAPVSPEVAGACGQIARTIAAAVEKRK